MSVDKSNPYRFGLIGTGWRAAFFRRLALQAPEHFRLAGVVTRTAERAAEVASAWQVPAVQSVGELVRTARPEFVVVCVPWGQTAAATIACVEEGVATLAETPPAADLDGLRALWQRVGSTARVQVAEQYLLMPGHRVRRTVAREGTIGEVTSVQVSSTHLYHAVSMIRGLLEVGRDPVTVTARSFTAPLADPLNPDGWTGSAQPQPRETTLALLDLGAGRSAVYDFTDNQWWNPLRARRIIVRGSRGEIADDTVVRLLDATTPVTSTIQRRRSGVDLDLEGVDLQHISFDGRVLYRNPFVGARFSEDDLAVAHLLAETGAWTRSEGPEPYPLAEGCQDHAVALAIQRSAATGTAVTTEEEPWR